MRVKHTVQVQITQDAAGKRKLYSDDATSALTDTSAFAMQMNSVLAIDPGVTENLSFRDVDQVKGLYLEVDMVANVRVNGSTDPIPLALASDSTKAKFFLEADITGLSVENPDTENILNGVYVVWGNSGT